MTSARTPADAFTGPPDPGRSGTVDDLVAALRLLKVWAGDPSYESITRQINTAWTAAGRPAAELARKNTVADCFRLGRRRLNPDLVLAVVLALHPDAVYVARWRRAFRMIGGHSQAATQVQVREGLPEDMVGFAGRVAELDRLRRALRDGQRPGGTAMIFAIEGMAGVGKTRLAIHAGHVLCRESSFDRVLFVNLRGFHPDLAQPPAEPAAVLDGFLRLLGVPGSKIPPELSSRAAAYRARLAGSRCLVILDNAADAEQARPLLPEAQGCMALVTSRRSLADLRQSIHLSLNVFTPDDAVGFLTRAVPEVPIGPDPHSAARIAHRCGHLPLALGLITGHIRARPGWTLTDHADRLDDRHRERRLDGEVEIALDLSYRQLTADRQRLLRLAALHPGQDFDIHAAAALVGAHLDGVRTWLRQLSRDHLLQQTAPGRYTLHDLVRAYAAGLAVDDDPPAARRAALTRLFDYYLSTAAAAMDVLAPAETHRRPRIPPPTTPTPSAADVDAARAWLDAERANLVAVTAHAAIQGWPTHATRMSTTLARYLTGGHHADAFAVHGHALEAARRRGDPVEQAWALTRLGAAHLRLGQDGPAIARLRQALPLFERAGDRTGQARALATLGDIEQRLGDYRSAADHHKRALALYRQADDRTGEAHALTKLGIVAERLGNYQSAADYHELALALFRRAEDRLGEAAAMCNLGDVQGRLGLPTTAADHLDRALTLYRRAGNRDGEAWTLDNLGSLSTRRARPVQAVEHHRRALAIHRETGERYGEASAHNGLGEAVHAAGRPAEALDHHRAAYAVAAEIGDRHQQARALSGMGHAARDTGDLGPASKHYGHALDIYDDLGTPEAEQVRAALAALEDDASTAP